MQQNVARSLDRILVSTKSSLHLVALNNCVELAWLQNVDAQCTRGDFERITLHCIRDKQLVQHDFTPYGSGVPMMFSRERIRVVAASNTTLSCIRRLT